MPFGRVFPENDNVCRSCSAPIVSNPFEIVESNLGSLICVFSMISMKNIDYRPFLESSVSSSPILIVIMFLILFIGSY